MTELQEKIIELRKQNVGMKAIAKMLNCNLWTVKEISKRYGLNGFLSDRHIVKPFETIKQEFECKYPDYELIYKDESIDGYMYVQCLYCGAMFRHTAQNLRPSRLKRIICENCEIIYQNHQKQERKKRYALYLVQVQKQKQERFWNQSFQQLTMSACKMCGQLFVQDNKRKKYCSEECSRHASVYDHGGKRERYRYLVPLKALSKRDKGICYLCGKPVDWKDYKIKNGIFYAGLKYPSRDHVVPQAMGGEHSWNNIKLAHMHCNIMKSDKLLK